MTAALFYENGPVYLAGHVNYAGYIRVINLLKSAPYEQLVTEHPMRRNQSIHLCGNQTVRNA